jgi:hypothetical protein
MIQGPTVIILARQTAKKLAFRSYEVKQSESALPMAAHAQENT